jgi:hypothetical protein
MRAQGTNEGMDCVPGSDATPWGAPAEDQACWGASAGSGADRTSSARSTNSLEPR